MYISTKVQKKVITLIIDLYDTETYIIIFLIENKDKKIKIITLLTLKWLLINDATNSRPSDFCYFLKKEF